MPLNGVYLAPQQDIIARKMNPGRLKFTHCRLHRSSMLAIVVYPASLSRFLYPILASLNLEFHCHS